MKAYRAIAEKMISEAKMNEVKGKFEQAAKAEWNSHKKKLQNRKYKNRTHNYKHRNKARKSTYTDRVVAGLVHQDSAHVTQHKRL